MVKKQEKKCSKSLAIQEMQIKTTLRFHPTPFRMAITNNTNNNTTQQQMLAKIWGKRNPHTLLVGM
jgi:hypothetical protein